MGIVLRLYNLASEPRNLDCSFNRCFERVQAVNLKEDFQRDIKLTDNKAIIKIGAKEILTLKLI